MYSERTYAINNIVNHDTHAFSVFVVLFVLAAVSIFSVSVYRYYSAIKQE